MKKSDQKRALAMLLCVMMVVTLLEGCGGLQSQLVGPWYQDGHSASRGDGTYGPHFTLYSDGTCEIAHEYGTGKWSVVNDNMLKLTNYYGESMTVKIESVGGGCLKLEGGLTFYNAPKEGS